VKPNPLPYNADEILERMRRDVDSDWPSRLLNDITRIGSRHPLPLTPAEGRVLICTASGLGIHDTAKVLGVSTETVKSQRKTTIAKLGARNSYHAVWIGCHRGLIET
jgi:DNA-binding CsgD family transcriptional regulator